MNSTGFSHQTAEPQNMPVATSEPTPLFLKTFETSTIASASPWQSSSQNKLHELTGTGHPVGPRPTPGSDAMEDSSGYGYAGFPWTDEPQTMLSPSIPKSTSRVSEMDGTTPRNLLKPSRSTLTGGGSSAYGNPRFSRADEPHNTPMPTPPAQPRPHPQRRLSEYVAMVMALDSIPVGLSSF